MAEFPRSAWGAANAKSVGAHLSNVPYGVVHHIGGGPAYPSDVAATLHQIQATELHGDYVDIAYNWGVDRNGNLWELRGDVHDGATLGYAGQSFSVLAICNAADSAFIATPALIAGIAACFRNAQTRGVLSKAAYIDGHHWFDQHVTNSPTACPGVPLMAQIPQIRQLVANPTPVPKPVPWKVKPMYDPTITVPGGIRASLRFSSGELLIGPLGHLYALDGAPNLGGPLNAQGQPKPYWVGKQVATLELPNANEKAAGKQYVVVASDKSRYAYPE